MCSYPVPPWTLLGHAMSVPVLLERRRIRLPAPLRLLSAGPRVPGVLIAAHYGRGSSLVYNELALLVGAHRGLHVGVSIVRIWVDNEASVAGGRGIWGLAKERAAFEWQKTADRSCIEVRVGTRRLVHLEAHRAGPPLGWPGAVPLHVLTARAGESAGFRVHCKGRVSWAVTRSAVPQDVPAGELIGAKPVGGLLFRGLALVVDAPRRLGARADDA